MFIYVYLYVCAFMCLCMFVYRVLLIILMCMRTGANNRSAGARPERGVGQALDNCSTPTTLVKRTVQWLLHHAANSLAHGPGYYVPSGLVSLNPSSDLHQTRLCSQFFYDAVPSGGFSFHAWVCSSLARKVVAIRSRSSPSHSLAVSIPIDAFGHWIPCQVCQAIFACPH